MTTTANTSNRYQVADGVMFDPDLVGVSTLPGRPMFILSRGGGVSCLGLEVARRKASGVLAWIGDTVDLSAATPAEVWAAYADAMERGAAFHSATGIRCPIDLSPALIGLEGRRVEVTAPNGERSRFIVGKSSGWLPVHLAIARRNCHGGAAAYVPAGSTVRVVA